MKTILLFFAICCPFLGFSQMDYSSYEMDYFKKFGKEYKIVFSEKKGNVDRIFIDGQSIDQTYSNAFIAIDVKQMNKFLEYINFLKSKYVEWSKTATDNNVLNLDKPIDAVLKDRYIFGFGYSDWNFDHSVNLKANFKIVDGDCFLVINSGELHSSKNSYISCDGMVIVFSNVEEIDNFVSILNIDNMTSFLDEKSEKSHLFN